ncbi:MAG TPA: class I SAM-dependent methyltransferase [Mycobacterium sp.]|nr:class I SAM-dependent methyltransferase [Mycobacterium sp.]
MTLPHVQQHRDGLVVTDRASYGGIVVERVSVPDISADPRHAAAGEATRREISWINAELVANPQWTAPEVVGDDAVKSLQPNNPMASWLFGAAPGLRLWREQLVPAAIALTPLYEPETGHLPTGEPVDSKTREYFMHAYDAIGVRARAAIMSDMAGGHVGPDAGVTKWTSIACGAAIPVLDAFRKHTSGRIELSLVDIDQTALEHARKHALQRGLVEAVHFRLLRRNVIKDLMIGDRLVAELGPESQDLVDMLGIFEYIDEDFAGFKSAAAFLANAFRMVKPGGALVAANMLDSHPHLQFIQRAIGWPRVFPRSLGQIRSIIIGAGIDPAWVRLRIAEDGIYAVFEIKKPNDDAGALPAV